jgi:hypothetical protein
MRKFLIGFVTVALIASTFLFSTSAKAGNSEEVAIGILGGVIGGLVLGEVFEHRHRHKHRVHRELYVERCVVRYKRFYDPYYDAVIKRPIEQCWTERVQ